jgi:putative ubiquitin-RnfH superfamily antitoxin RatB of RatAB toxin-antitoxin module
MIEVTLSYSPAPREVFEQVLRLPPEATVDDAVKASDLAQRFPQMDWRQAMTPGIWGREVEWNQLLKDGDRIELCRPLAVDPKGGAPRALSAAGRTGYRPFCKPPQGRQGRLLSLRDYLQSLWMID